MWAKSQVVECAYCAQEITPDFSSVASSGTTRDHQRAQALPLCSQSLQLSPSQAPLFPNENVFYRQS